MGTIARDPCLHPLVTTSKEDRKGEIKGPKGR